MVIPRQFRCDCGCGSIRGEENHWFLVDPGESDGTFRVGQWDDSIAADPAYGHAAGAECVHKLLNAWLEKH